MPSEFVTPDPQEIVNALGVEPDITGETQRTVNLVDVTGEDLTFSYDAVGQSVTVRWCTPSGKVLLNMFREGAILLRVQEGDGETRLVVKFETGDTSGELRVQVFPEVSITETSLFS
ncbi:hypothetical protein [Streptomyces sp. RKAG290]|uniref:hypothetical protein n=1 Tax=Streptomyces sp. RKAG290 TaxID=2888348 RepID=UPI0020337DE2|nr:hypothetical protein [Streptomyces sp. RKAG290]MCM2411182.1 hypothetical protein [Streptomyces sp. RKAG290]